MPTRLRLSGAWALPGHARHGSHTPTQPFAGNAKYHTGAAPRFLKALARAGSLRAASGRFLKTLGQKRRIKADQSGGSQAPRLDVFITIIRYFCTSTSK